MADQTNKYDISLTELKLEQQRTARRNALRQEYMKVASSPFKSGEGGIAFDPALQRFIAAKTRTYDYFRPTLKNGAIFYASLITPLILISWYTKKCKDTQEHLYRTGQVSYADREWKFA
ncbi:uncharacterized protein LOC105685986 [Athalia rosae]|uniref:uncharacterized protein LOC105685986 n=1 Tax=Athalia rosae TaxID=37344 RepID=UPI002033786E|nr:uncharacterized protein LOC105685986 [Athalia rosae]XP_048504709.1 uncharacterized protein LOC105685986 [Athalia rosae]